jgi:hypothetical protein
MAVDGPQFGKPHTVDEQVTGMTPSMVIEAREVLVRMRELPCLDPVPQFLPNQPDERIIVLTFEACEVLLLAQ